MSNIVERIHKHGGIESIIISPFYVIGSRKTRRRLRVRSEVGEVRSSLREIDRSDPVAGYLVRKGWHLVVVCGDGAHLGCDRTDEDDILAAPPGSLSTDLFQRSPSA